MKSCLYLFKRKTKFDFNIYLFCSHWHNFFFSPASLDILLTFISLHFNFFQSMIEKVFGKGFDTAFTDVEICQMFSRTRNGFQVVSMHFQSELNWMFEKVVGKGFDATFTDVKICQMFSRTRNGFQFWMRRMKKNRSVMIRKIIT